MVPECVYGIKKGSKYKQVRYDITQVLLFKWCENCLKPLVRVGERCKSKQCPYCGKGLDNIYLIREANGI